MNHISINRIKFYKFLCGTFPLADFEKWIYDNPTLETEIGADPYLDLISYNFNSNNAVLYIKAFVQKYFNWTEFEYWRTIKLLRDILDDKIEIVLATKKMREIYLEQEYTINKPLMSIELAIGYESELDGCPLVSEYYLWEKLALEKSLEPIGWYKNGILETVKQELNILMHTDNGRFFFDFN